MADVVRPEETIDATEYERRFKECIVKTLCPWTIAEATDAARDAWNAVSLEEHQQGGFETDPEGAASEEMSYWDNDGE